MKDQPRPASVPTRRPKARSLRNGVALFIFGMLAGAMAVKFFTPVPSQANLTAIPPPPRIERSCKVGAGKTAVIVVHGQSNAANYGNTRYVAREQVDNFDPASGKCFAAADPLLGADGAGGAFATRLGDILIEARRYDRVIVVPIAVGGASLAVLDNEEAPRIANAVAKLKSAHLTPTHILFQLGEKDAMLTTSSQDYVARLHKFVARFRDAGFDAPFYVSQTSKCDVGEPGNRASVRAGQLAAISEPLNIRRGPDTDLVNNDGRNPFDGCHLNEMGLIAIAALWAAAIH